jgi:hypothetical protein
VKALLVISLGLLLSGCALFSPIKSIKKSDLETVSVRQTDYGWQLIHQRIALIHPAEESTVRPILERSMDQRTERLCEGGVHSSDRQFERLYVLDHAPAGKHHSHNLLARVVCQDAVGLAPKVFLETLQNSTYVFQVIGTTYHIKTPDVATLTAQIKAQLAEPVNQVCPGLLSVQSVEYRHSQTTEQVFDTVEWPVEQLRVVATVTCQ